MEDIIYVVLIIVWLLVSFLKRKPKTQKPAQKRTEPSTGSEPIPAEEVNMEDMLEEFFGSKKKKKEEPVKTEPIYETRERREQADYPYRKEVSKNQVEEQMQPVYENYSGKEEVSDDFEFTSEGKIQTIDDLINQHKAKEAIELARAEEEYGTGSDDIPDFDLRTAVIFSEILNKKYS
jgi:aconitase A